MIFDRLENSERYAKLHPGIAAAFEFLKRPDAINLPAGSHEIDGRRLYVDIHRRTGKAHSDIKFEAHRRYIDIQYTFEDSATDELGWTTTRLLTDVLTEYNPQKDAILFKSTGESWLASPPGTLAIFFPEDGHCAMQGKGELHKAVVKVLIDW